MADEGKFEPGCAQDVILSVPVLGDGSICVDGDALRVRMTFEEKLQAVGSRPRRRSHELAYPWADVLAVASDARDPRVIVLVVQHEGEPRMLRFRPEQPTPAILADIEWMAANAFGDDEDDLSIEITPCSGKGCRHCEELQALLRAHEENRPS